MRYCIIKTGFAIASIFAVSDLSASAADMVETYRAPHHVVVIRHHRHHHAIRMSAEAISKHCAPVIYEYRSDPGYTDVKTVCSPPWTKPAPTTY